MINDRFIFRSKLFHNLLNLFITRNITKTAELPFVNNCNKNIDETKTCYFRKKQKQHSKQKLQIN